MRRDLLIGAALVAALVCQTAHAEPLAYLRATSQYESDANPASYHPLNLADDDSSTMWCEGAPGLGEGEEIRFFFKKNQRIDRIIIGPADGSGRLVRVVKVTDGVNTVRIDLGNVYSEMTLKRPMVGSTYVVTIEEVGGPNKGSELGQDVACLAEVLLYYKRRAFGGKAPLSKLRYDARRDQILGRWSGEPLGAPEGFITFSLDGTWDWKFVPLLGGKTERRTGEYRFRGNRLLMRRGETGRWADMRFKYREVAVDPDDIGAPLGDYQVVFLGAKLLGEKIAGEYNNAQF